MNYREYAKSLIDQIPEHKLLYVMCFLMGASIPDKSDDTGCEQPAQEQEVFAGK